MNEWEDLVPDLKDPTMLRREKPRNFSCRRERAWEVGVGGVGEIWGEL